MKISEHICVFFSSTIFEVKVVIKGSWTGDLGDQHEHYQKLISKAESTNTPLKQMPIFENLAQEFIDKVYAIPLFEFPIVTFADSNKIEVATINANGSEVLPENIKQNFRKT